MTNEEIKLLGEIEDKLFDIIDTKDVFENEDICNMWKAWSMLRDVYTKLTYEDDEEEL